MLHLFGANILYWGDSVFSISSVLAVDLEQCWAVLPIIVTPLLLLLILLSKEVRWWLSFSEVFDNNFVKFSPSSLLTHRFTLFSFFGFSRIIARSFSELFDSRYKCHFDASIFRLYLLPYLSTVFHFNISVNQRVRMSLIFHFLRTCTVPTHHSLLSAACPIFWWRSVFLLVQHHPE